MKKYIENRGRKKKYLFPEKNGEVKIFKQPPYINVRGAARGYAKRKGFKIRTWITEEGHLAVEAIN